MWKIAAGFVVGLVLLTPAANAQFTRQEVIAFESAMMPVEDFLNGKKGTPVTLAGYLRLPKRNEKNPAVILFHDGGGLGRDHRRDSRGRVLLQGAGRKPQSRSSSLIDVLARVRSSTRLTMTAQ